MFYVHGHDLLNCVRNFSVRCSTRELGGETENNIPDNLINPALHDTELVEELEETLFTDVLCRTMITCYVTFCGIDATIHTRLG